MTRNTFTTSSSLITCRMCGLQDVAEMSQPLHMRVNGHRYDIVQRRTEEFPVVERFISGANVESDMTVMVNELARNRDACLCTEDAREQVDEDLGYFIPF